MIRRRLAVAAILFVAAGCRDLSIVDRDLGVVTGGDLGGGSIPDGEFGSATVLVGLDPAHDFTPPTVTIGTQAWVTWLFEGGTHSLVSDSKPPAWDATDDQSNGAHGELFATPGTYPYHCGVHPWQTGTIIVVP